MTEPSRQLAAIVFSDIVGYSAIMQESETEAVEKVNRFREVIETKTPFFHGRIIQYYGDGCLLLFNSAVDAVALAKDLQSEFCEEPQLPVRIGIHVGDVLIKDGNVFGDAVNIAARIQALAPPGGILISEAVQKNIANKQNISTEYLKTEVPKNIKEPIRIYNVKTDRVNIFAKFKGKGKRPQKRKIALITGGVILLLLTTYFFYGVSQKANVISANPTETSSVSLAVLPFSDNSPKHDMEYLGDGIAEDILTVLSNTMKDLILPARASSFYFKGKGVDMKTIGKILKVKYIMEGSVQSSGNQLRVAVNLNDAASGNLIWSDRYDVEMKDLFTIRDEIAAEVGNKLKVTLYKENEDKAEAEDPRGLEMIFKGNYYFAKGLSGFDEAVDYYKNAIAIDSNHGHPHVRLGWTYYQMTLSGEFASDVGFEKARNEFEKALTLKMTVADKHSAYRFLAFINLWGFQWKKANDEYQKFLDINPRQDMFNAFYQSLALGNTDEGVAIAQKMSEENPVDELNLRDFALLQYLGRKYNDALQTCDKMLELDSNFSEALRIKGNIYSAEKKPDSALYFFAKSAALGNQRAQAFSIITLPQIGQKEEARKLFANALKENPEMIPPVVGALFYYSIGETKKAMEWLNKTYEAKFFWLATLRVDPIWDPMRNEPEFQKLMKKMDFPK
jgi:TolB-like protein/class 3 adenylate cyclase/Tfp pilus assembly protein PilF